MNNRSRALGASWAIKSTIAFQPHKDTFTHVQDTLLTRRAMKSAMISTMSSRAEEKKWLCDNCRSKGKQGTVDSTCVSKASDIMWLGSTTPPQVVDLNLHPTQAASADRLSSGKQ